MTRKRPIPPLTDAEEAKVQRQIASDPDSPELTDEQMAQVRPFSEAFPDLMASIKRARGPQKAPTKVPVSIRLSPEVVEHFKAGGPGWQARIDEALRKMVGGR